MTECAPSVPDRWDVVADIVVAGFGGGGVCRVRYRVGPPLNVQKELPGSASAMP